MKCLCVKGLMYLEWYTLNPLTLKIDTSIYFHVLAVACVQFFNEVYMRTRHFRIVMFVHKKWAVTLFAFQEYSGMLELEDTGIFFNLTILVVQQRCPLERCL